MDDLFKKVLDPQCLSDTCPSCQEDCPCEFIKRYILIIKSSEFQSCLVRLLKHKKNSTQLTEDEQDRVSVFGTDKLEIICMRDIKVHLVDAKTEEPLENSSVERQCYADEKYGSWKLYIKLGNIHNTGETQAFLLSHCIDRILRWILDAECLRAISSMLLCKSPSQLSGVLDQLEIAEDFSEEELKIGGEVPVVFHYLLQQNPLFIFHTGEIVAYGIEANEPDEGAEEMGDGFIPMRYVLAKVISRTDETDSDDSYDFTAEYLIDLGNAGKIKVSVVDLYKFVQNDVPENVTDLVPFTGDPTIMPSSLDEAKREIREALTKAWGLPHKLRRKVIRRLFLRWHPDKNPDNVEFAQEMFKFLLSEIKRMEVEESNIDDSCNFTNLFTGWNRHARRERDTYNNFRTNCGSGCSTRRPPSDYTYPNVSEARRWLKQAERDLEAAQLLFSSSTQSFDALVCFLSHQVVEKSLKAALYAKCGLTNDQLHTHDVYSLARHVSGLRGSPAEITDMAIVVSNYYLTTRYPNQQPGSIIPADAFGTEQSKRALENASELFGTVTAFTDA
jgi:sacsin